MLDAPNPDWEGYNRLYSIFPLKQQQINIKFFSLQPSNIFHKYFKKSHHFIKRCESRAVRYRSEEYFDDDFVRFISKHSPFQTVPLYTLTQPSIEIGYAEASKFGCRNLIVLEQPLRDRVLELWARLYAPYIKTQYRDIFQVMAKLAPDTSCGWPLSNCFPTKSEFRNFKYTMTAYCQYFSEMANEETYIPSICTSAVKLELRKFEKVINDQARTFNPCPVFSQLLYLQYYMAYDESISKNWAYLPFSMGFTDKYRGADKLIRWMSFEGCLDKDETVLFIESDVTGWDRNVQAPLLSLAWEMERMILPEEYLREPHYSRLKNLFFDGVHSYVMLELGDLFFSTNGMKSGWPNTLRKNSEMNIAVCLIILIIMKPDITFSEILLFFRFKVQGDDFFGALRIKHCPWFSAEKWKTVIKDVCGFTLKHIVMTHDVTKIEFLGRHFKMSEYGCWLAVPDRFKMIDAFCVHKTSDKSAIMMKMLNLRIEAWPDYELFVLLTKWIDECFINWDRELSVPKGMYVTQEGTVDHIFTREKIYAQYLPESVIRLLHTGIDPTVY